VEVIIDNYELYKFGKVRDKIFKVYQGKRD